MKPCAYCLFETRIGSCGIAWCEDGGARSSAAICFFQLPEATPQETEARIARRSGACKASPPPPQVAAIIKKICRHLEGAPQDLTDIPLDLASVAPFARQVYEVARKIPPGQTMTYGAVAKSLGQPGAARAVGQALGRNPIALIIPCHRVLAANNKPGGFSAHGGRTTKARMLEIEGAPAATSAFAA